MGAIAHPRDAAAGNPGTCSQIVHETSQKSRSAPDMRIEDMLAEAICLQIRPSTNATPIALRPQTQRRRRAVRQANVDKGNADEHRASVA